MIWDPEFSVPEALSKALADLEAVWAVFTTSEPGPDDFDRLVETARAVQELAVLARFEAAQASQTEGVNEVEDEIEIEIEVEVGVGVGDEIEVEIGDEIEVGEDHGAQPHNLNPQSSTLRGEAAPQPSALRGEAASHPSAAQPPLNPQSSTLRGEAAPQSSTLRGEAAPQSSTLRSEAAPQPLFPLLGLNDRIRYAGALFGGNVEALREACAVLDGLADRQEAHNWLKSSCPVNWEDAQGLPVRFLEWMDRVRG